jgi:hypothetical protein
MRIPVTPRTALGQIAPKARIVAEICFDAGNYPK